MLIHSSILQIMPRAQNAHAYVNAGFLFRMKVNDGGKVLGKPTIVYGGINPQFVSMMMMMMMITMAKIWRHQGRNRKDSSCSSRPSN